MEHRSTHEFSNDDDDENQTNDDAPLVSVDEMPLTVDSIGMLSTYANACIKLLNFLQQRPTAYVGVRSVKRDGNCFFRAFLFALAEACIPEEGAVQPQPPLGKRIAAHIRRKAPPLFAAAGYDQLVWDDVLEDAANFFAAIAASSCSHKIGRKEALCALIAAFNEAIVSNTLVLFARLAVGAELRTAPADRYAPFVNVGESDAEFGTWDAFVAAAEAFGRESDHVAIRAACEFFGVTCRVLVVDNSEALLPFTTEVQPVEGSGDEDEGSSLLLADDGKPLGVSLVYRPGHYDVLRIVEGNDSAAAAPF